MLMRVPEDPLKAAPEVAEGLYLLLTKTLRLVRETCPSPGESQGAG
jgi:hypothetical protein